MVASCSSFRRHLGKVIWDLLHAPVYSDYPRDAEASGYILWADCELPPLNNGANGRGKAINYQH